jgi:hypothetical protein
MNVNNKSLSQEGRLAALNLYREHLASQYADRSILWALQAASAQVRGFATKTT